MRRVAPGSDHLREPRGIRRFGGDFLPIGAPTPSPGDRYRVSMGAKTRRETPGCQKKHRCHGGEHIAATPEKGERAITDSSLVPGTILRDRYHIEGILDSGGMSVLYLASDQHLPGRWVIKEMRALTPNAEDREAILGQFRREAQILGTLSHPGLPRVTDFFEERERLFLVEEFLEGRNLMQVASAGRFTEEEAVDCAIQLLDVLVYLHQSRIVYRDVKPDNVIVGSDRRYHLVDFGIARLFSVGKRRDTVLMGTPGFASPEHYGNRQTDERSDIFSLGATLHFLVTGRDPGERPFLFDPPDELVPGLSEWFADIVMTALETEPADRFQTAAEMRAALEGPRHLIRRARSFHYSCKGSLLPRWERPLQVAAALPGMAGIATLSALGLVGLPVGLVLLLPPAVLLVRCAEEYRRTYRKHFVATPRELQIWENDRPLKVPWHDIGWIKVRKYQHFFRLRRDIGEKEGSDSSIRVACVEVYFKYQATAWGRPGQASFRFTSELDDWDQLLGILLARTGLRPVARFVTADADEEYRR